MNSLTWKALPARYHVKKRQAFKVEKMPEPKEKRPQAHSATDTEYFSYKRKEKPKTCVICGLDATYRAYFDMDKATVLEKYCDSCLDKYVIQ